MAVNEDGIDFESIVNDKLSGIDIMAGDDSPVVPPDAPASTPPVEAPTDTQPQKTEDEIISEKIAADEAETELAKNETPEETEARHAKAVEETEAAKKAADEAAALVAAPTNISVDDFKKVLDERDAQVAFDKKRYQEINTEVTSDLYPNGFDTTLKDEKGNVILTAEDYKTYIDPNATIEDAQRIIMNEQSRLNKEVQQAKDFVAEKAELKNTMENEAVIVFKKYKDYFLKNPDMQVKIANSYRKTLKLLNNTIIEAPLGLEEFYDFAMQPYIDNLQKTTTTTTVAPVETPPEPKEKISDERLDLVGTPTDDNGLVVDGKPNWKKIVSDKLKGK